MNEHEFFQRALSDLHASDDTLQEVMSRAHSRKGAKSISKRFVVLSAVLVIIFSMALVAHGTLRLSEHEAVLTPAQEPGQIIDDAFGNKISAQKPQMQDCFGNPIELPDMERPVIDLTEAEKAIGAYICDVGAVLSVGDNTFTLKNFLIDETGTGAIVWTVENPNGVAYSNCGYGIVQFAPEAPFDNPGLYHYGADGHEKFFVCDFTALISENEEGTRLKLVTYFGTFDKYQIGDSLVWRVSRNNREEMQTIQITPTKHIPAKIMTTADGMRLTIANQNLTFDLDCNEQAVFKKIVIHFRDGTQYCLKDDEKKVDNSIGSLVRSSETYHDDDLVYLFNRIIDTNEVSSVEATVDYIRYELVGEQYETVHHEKTVIFYP